MDTKKMNSILIVDDELLNLKMLRSILHDEYIVFTAKDGLTAIAIASKEKPDLILLDILMPEMDGYEVLGILKSDSETRHIPVIFITGLDSKTEEEKGLSMDAVDYISKPFSPGIVHLRVKNQIQIVNQIRTIELLSNLDQLTQIPNRRSLDQQLISEWGRSIRENIPLSLLMIDVDKFKVYNDKYGHLQGDTVLQMIAETIVATLQRAGDFAARFGGEEFCVLLPGADMDGAMLVAEQIRKAIETLVFRCEDGTAGKVTISVGVHSLIPNVTDTIPDMIAKADKAMYAAKEAGRNCVRQYTEDR
ncbi:MAG: diguanylate cyclase [Oscillospiraceae bacterium]|nr:diguanylate cyclase [Oscillospiraceae bacterium]